MDGWIDGGLFDVGNEQLHEVEREWKWHSSTDDEVFSTLLYDI